MFTKKLFIWALAAVAISFYGCNEKDPDPTIEEEAITRVVVKLTPQSGGTTQTVTWSQVGIASATSISAPTNVSGSFDLSAGLTYNGTIEFWNDDASPAENVTEEIEELAQAHLIFYQPLPCNGTPVIPGVNCSSGSPLNLTINVTDNDGGSPARPVGLQFTATAGAASTGSIRVVLRHQPDGKDGTFAPGSTDFDSDGANFPVIISTTVPVAAGVN